MRPRKIIRHIILALLATMLFCLTGCTLRFKATDLEMDGETVISYALEEAELFANSTD